MKLFVDTSKIHAMVSKEPAEKVDDKGRQRTERGSGRPMWSTQVFVQGDEGGDVINVTTAGARPDVSVGEIVTLPRLEALPWATNGRNGVAFRAEEIKAAPPVSSVKSA